MRVEPTILRELKEPSLVNALWNALPVRIPEKTYRRIGGLETISESLNRPPILSRSCK